MLRIRSDGKIGINQRPTRELSLHSPDNNNALIHFTNDDTGETASDGILIGLNGNEDMIVNNQESSKNIIINNGGSERARLDSSGRLLIGKTSGSFKLEVSGDESTMRLTNSGESGSGNENCKLVAGGSHYQNLVHVGSAISFRTYNGSSEGERWRIRSNGHLESNDTNLYLLRTGTTGDNDICFGDSADDDIGRIRYDHDDNSLQFSINAGERARINQYGMMGLSVTSPDAMLSVLAQNSNTPPFVIQNPSNDENFTISTYYDANGIYGGIGANYKVNSGGNAVADTTDHRTAGILFDARNNGNIVLQTNTAGNQPTTRLEVDQNGDVLINQPAEAAGRLGIKGTNGSGTTCYAVTNSGKALEGIDVNCTTVGDGNYGGGISFGCGGNGRSAIAGYQDGGDDDVNGLTFFTHSSAVGSDNTVERMRLLATGRLGLYTEATGGTTAARFQIGKDDSDPVAPMVYYGPFGKNGKMYGKYVHNGSGATSNNTNLLTITAFQSTNSHIFGKVNVMGVSPVADYGFEAEGFFYGERGSSNTDITNANFGTMDLVGGTNQTRGTGGSAQGSLSFSGTTLVYATPAVAYATMRINVEFMTYDGATVVFDASQGLD